MKLHDSIAIVPFIGGKYQSLLGELGIYTLNDLIQYYPVKYIDTSKIYPFQDLSQNEKRATVGVLEEFKSKRTRSKITIQEALFSSKNEDLHVIWFNQPFLKNTLKTGDTYILLGKLNSKSSDLELLSPEIEELRPETKHLGRISPVYPLTHGIKNKWLRSRIKWVLDKFDYITDFTDRLEPKLQKRFNLIDLYTAIHDIHFVPNQKALDKAKKRIGFEELLDIQIKIEKQRLVSLQQRGLPIHINHSKINSIIKSLKFELTADQNTVIDTILKELDNVHPMNHLLQGDVGTGKTIIAILMAAATTAQGFKVVYLAPTTILADQIFEAFTQILDKKDIHLITSKSNYPENPSQHAILIGTHAILHLNRQYLTNINLIIIDEEHRFGVKQRDQLLEIESEYRPHKLTMTATPIPRSLAMTIWGDTSISYIRTKPKGRKPIRTFFTPKGKLKDSYHWIKEQIKASNTQVFWVCPLISKSTMINAKSAEEVYKDVEKYFKNFRVWLVHGKTKNKEEEILKFKNHEFDILVTTPIIEVGIDIPNANIMVIESSEHFGLAQLHQFRGRVGRGDKQGVCILYPTERHLTNDQKSRLKFFVNESDGLKLSTFDLERRGPGEVYGTKQSGIPDLKVANIFDIKLLTIAKKVAKMIITL